MAEIRKVETGYYRVPLPVTLSDSTHGDINAFELITARVGDSDGAEGVGYTYTVGRNGGAVADILRRRFPNCRRAGRRRYRGGLAASGGRCITAAGRRFGAGEVGARHRAMGSKARRANLPLWRFLGGFDRRVPCLPAASISNFPSRVC
jgi:L-alanine-DL-glutamate epimerase-like enolase superfamily enzyme